MTKSRPPVLMFSGGLDSLIAWYFLKKPKAVFVHLGHRYCASEYFTAQAIARRVGMDLTLEKRLYLGDHEKPDAFIPMRNLFLAMIGALYGDHIYLVFQRGEQELADRSRKFLETTSDFLSFLNGREIVVDSPFLDLTKAAMIKWYLEAGYPVDVLYKTFSCYLGDSTKAPCGQCPACFRRWVAFEHNGLTVTFRYDIKTWPGIKKYVRKMKEGKYDPVRTRETIEVLRRHGLWK